jgi:hypothetical protein
LVLSFLDSLKDEEDSLVVELGLGRASVSPLSPMARRHQKVRHLMFDRLINWRSVYQTVTKLNLLTLGGQGKFVSPRLLIIYFMWHGLGLFVQNISEPIQADVNM